MNAHRFNPLPFHLSVTTLFFLLGGIVPEIIQAQDSTFSYQGRLQNNGTPSDGTYDFRFELFDLASGGSSLGLIARPSIPVTGGLYTTTLDYGIAVFGGDERWLEVSVSPQGAGTYSTLSPRHRLTATPYAILAASVPASGVTGTLASANLSGSYTGAVAFSNPGNAFAGDGSSLTNVQATSLAPALASLYWQIGGNAGVAANRYIGTTDYQPIELRVNDSPAVRIVPTTPNWPNLVNGAFNNYIESDVTAASVGGGRANGISNVSGASWIGGGSTNVIQDNSAGSVVGGGTGNVLGDGAVRSVISGGWSNFIGGDTRAVARDIARYITDGTSNTILVGEAPPGTGFIGGGWSNRIGADAPTCSISGGSFNRIADGTSNTILPFPTTEPGGCFIGGGRGNRIENASPSDVIAGGDANVLLGDGAVRFIGGGRLNSITDGTSNTIIAGESNVINTGSNYATIGGGTGNGITGGYGMIGGGFNNTATAAHVFIGGGKDNTAGGPASVITGGSGNSANGNTAAVVGGQFNSAGGDRSFVGGGAGNQATGETSTVGGGTGNQATGLHATIPGGDSNSAAQRAFAAGTRAKAVNTGTFVWADSTDADFSSTGNDQFLIRATGGVGIGITNPTEALHVDGNILATGTVNGTSDRHVKENFAPLDSRTVLEKVASMPIQRWNYIGESNVQHVGPVAQDFHAAFTVGTDERHIAMVDADGIALAAIQGLNQKLAEELSRRDQENARVTKENEQIKARLDALEKALQRLISP